MWELGRSYIEHSVRDLLDGHSFGFRSNFTPQHCSDFTRFHAGAGAFGNQAALKVGTYADRLPHMRRVAIGVTTYP